MLYSGLWICLEEFVITSWSLQTIVEGKHFKAFFLPFNMSLQVGTHDPD